MLYFNIAVISFVLVSISIFGNIDDNHYNNLLDNSDVVTTFFSSQYIPNANGEVAPNVTIIDPFMGSTIPSNEIIINGSVIDNDNNIKNVEVLIHGYPFEQKYDYVPAILQGVNRSIESEDLYENETKTMSDRKSNGNITESEHLNWSASLQVDRPGVYRVLAHAEDSVGNDDWDGSLVHVPFIINQDNQYNGINPTPVRIALVNPIFTETAYSSDGFYTFYALHKPTKPGEKVYSNLSLFTPNMYNPPFPSLNKSYNYEQNMQDFSQINKDNAPIITLYNHIKQDLMPGANVTVIKDQDIQHGYIFNKYTKNNNAYDLLIFFHEEYITEKMYQNVKNFVRNGGTALFMDGNNMYAEVNYDRFNNTITLVEGHGWKFNGEFAQRGPFERWFNENKEWIGSNYLRASLGANITFGHNPFNYSHFEENFVNNQDANIIVDYKVNIPETSPYLGAAVATYDIIFGKGKVMHMGLYSQNLLDNQKFVAFVDSLLLSVFPLYNDKK